MSSPTPRPAPQLPRIAQGRPALVHVAAVLIALAVGLLAMTVPAQAEDKQAREARLEAMLDELEQVKKRLAKSRDEHKTLHRALRKSDTRIGELAKQHDALLEQERALNEQLAAQQREQQTVRDDISAQHALLAKQLQALYKMGQPGTLALLLSRRDPTNIDRDRRFWQYIGQARQQQVEQYRELLARSEALAADIELQQAAIASNRRELDSKLAALTEQQGKRQQQLQKLDSAIASGESRVQLLHKDSAALQQLLDAVGKASSKHQPAAGDSNADTATAIGTGTLSAAARSRGEFASARGQLPWPVNGKLKHRYGSKRPGSELQWQGVSIAADSGAPVQAIYSGRVVFADWFQGQGLLMIIDHGDGYMSLYGHNESLLHGAGDWVTAGETIATVGTSGGQKVAALYFEIRHNGKPSDPNRWCASS